MTKLIMLKKVNAMSTVSVHYTARLYFNEEVIFIEDDEDLDKLIVDLAELLEDEFRHADGEIIDNHNGKIVHRCRMVASD